jgi:hypothetical protein
VDVTLNQEDFLSCSFQTFARILTDASSRQIVDDAALFRASWKWGTAEISHMMHLPEILQSVAVPTNITIEELMKLSMSPLKRTGDPADSAPAPAWPALHQARRPICLAEMQIDS